MTKKFRRHMMSSVTVLSISLAFTSPSHAQAVSEGVDNSGEIVVTARKRSETLDKVPISVDVFTDQTIAKAGIARPQDFVALTPGVTMSNQVSISAGDTQIQIRGLTNSRDTEPNFALVIDGVLQTNPGALNQELFDIRQIEILKGPQGAIYGRNAVAGAINITTELPTDTFTGSLKGGYGNLKSGNISGSISGPIAPNLDFRLGASYRTTDGDLVNSYTGKHNVNAYWDFSARGRLVWNPDSTFTADLIGSYSKISSSAFNFNALTANPTLATFFGPDFFADINDHRYVYANNIEPINSLKRYGLSLRLVKDFDFGTLTAVAAYNHQKEVTFGDGTSTGFGQYLGGSNAAVTACQASLPILQNNLGLAPAPFNNAIAFGAGLLGSYSPTTCDGYQYQLYDQKDQSVEIRLASRGSGPFRWMFGGYFANIDREIANAYGADLGQSFVVAPYVPPTGPNPTDQLFWDDNNTKVYSVFADMGFELVRSLELSVSARYDSERHKVHPLVPNVNAGILPGPINPGLASGPLRDQAKTYQQFQPKISLRWEFMPDSSIYSSYGKGFRAGGFNPQGTAAIIAQYFNDPNPVYAQSVNAGLTIGDEYKKETVDSYELGFKTSLADKRIRIEGALFQQDIHNQQFYEVLVGQFGLVKTVSNIDRARVRGFELGATVRPTDWISLDGSYSLLNSTIKRNTNRPETVGNRLPFIPTYTLNASIQLDVPVSGDLRFTPRVALQRLGKTWFSTVQNNQVPTTFASMADFSKTRREAYNLVDGRAGLGDGRWTIAVWVRNLFDKHYISDVAVAPEFGGLFASPGLGRTYGLDASIKF